MLIVGTTAWAKTDIQVLTPQRVVFGRTFEVSYLVNGNGQSISMKTSDKFDVVGGPYRQAENYTMREKGRLVTRTRTMYTYRLVARESGEQKLPKVKVKLTKGSASSKAVKVDVQEPRRFEPMDFWGFEPFGDPFFEQQAPCDRRHPQHQHPGHKGHPGQGNCPHHEVHIETFTPDQIDTTGCEVTVCAPDSAVEGENFCLSYSIGAKADSIQLSDTTDFEIVGGPGYGTSWQSTWENGKQQNRFEQRYTYIVRARKAGELALPKADIWIGQTRKPSNAKTITVQAKQEKQQ